MNSYENKQKDTAKEEIIREKSMDVGTFRHQTWRISFWSWSVSFSGNRGQGIWYSATEVPWELVAPAASSSDSVFLRLSLVIMRRLSMKLFLPNYQCTRCQWLDLWIVFVLGLKKCFGPAVITWSKLRVHFTPYRLRNACCTWIITQPPATSKIVPDHQDTGTTGGARRSFFLVWSIIKY